MRDSFIANKINGLKPSGIRKFFDVAATMKDVISLGIGEPDFDTASHRGCRYPVVERR
jgi:aminotransferase